MSVPKLSIHRLVYIIGAGVLCAGLLVPTARSFGEDKKDPPARKSSAPVEVTDKEVLESIRRGVKFLLQSRTGDNWETGDNISGPNATNTGGETALVLYALLHVGHGVQDDPELGPLLRFNSKDLEPVVRYLGKLDPKGTYTAGLQASALSMVPKGTDLYKEVVEAGLKRARDYLLEAMGSDGGYTYTVPVKQKDAVDFPAQWKVLVDAVARNDKKAADDAKGALEEMARRAANTFAGVRGHVEGLQSDIRTRITGATTAKDGAARQRAEAELRLLAQVSPDLLKQRGGSDTAKQLAEAQKWLAEAERALKTGKAEKSVKEMVNGVKVEKKVPKTKEEIQKDYEDARRRLEREIFEAKNNFNGIGDLSNGQYGTLGAWALSDAEFEMPLAYWQVSDRFWRLTQRQDGCWGYQPSGEKPEATMGVAGLASLFTSSEQVDTGLRLEPRVDREIERGLAWLNSDFKANLNGYYMYGVERVGLASGLKFFGTTNWYKEGAKLLIRAQSADGAWEKGGFHGANKNRSTAYNLLFLVRGRNPVIFNKLEYAGPWNARPRDNANLTGWISKKFERPINWQIVNLKVPVEELLDAPVLMISGSKALKFTPEEVAKIRDYVGAGGTVFSWADGSANEFTESVKKLASQVVEENGKAKYEMRELPKKHVLYSASGSDLWAPVQKPQRILGMNNGVRELWVHATNDMGASFQARRTKEGLDDFTFATNLYRYVSGKLPLRTKLQPLTIADADVTPKRNVTLGRLEHNGNWDPEPGAWPRMARIMARDAKTQVTLRTVKFADVDPKVTPVVHMTGTTGFPVSSGDAGTLKKFLEGGGTLIADAANASAPFRQSFDAMITAALGGSVAMENVPATSSVLNGTLPDGVDATKAEYRRSYLLKVEKRSTPALRGIKIAGRWAVLVSDADITSGLLGTNTWDVLGYQPEFAQDLARNLILYGENPKGGKDGAAAAGGDAVGEGTR